VRVQADDELAVVAAGSTAVLRNFRVTRGSELGAILIGLRQIFPALRRQLVLVLMKALHQPSAMGLDSLA
jgi:hypothetical protein